MEFNPQAPIATSAAERILVALSIGALAVFIALGDKQLTAVALVVLVVCLLMMYFRGDRTARRRAIKANPQSEWAEYDRPSTSQAVGSIAIFALVFLAAVCINLFVTLSATPLIILLAVLGFAATVAVFFLPAFTQGYEQTPAGRIPQASA